MNHWGPDADQELVEATLGQLSKNVDYWDSFYEVKHQWALKSWRSRGSALLRNFTWDLSMHYSSYKSDFYSSSEKKKKKVQKPKLFHQV